MGDVKVTNGKFALLLGKRSPYIFSKFNLLYKDTPLTRTHGPLSVRINSVLLSCTRIHFVFA